MNFYYSSTYPFFNPSNVLIVDSDSKIIPIGTSIISTPYTNPVLAVTTSTDSKPYNTVYSFPISPALDLNHDPDVHDTVTNSIYRQLLQNWMYSSEYEEVFKYIKLVDDRPRLITSFKEKDRNTSSSVIDRKVTFIKDNIITKNRIKKILEDFVYSTRTNWYDIEKNTYYVKDLILRYIKKKLKALVDKKSEE